MARPSTAFGLDDGVVVGKVLVVGDMSVGKTCLVQALCHGSATAVDDGLTSSTRRGRGAFNSRGKVPRQRCPPTVGCNVQVIQYQQQSNRWLEFWDVGGYSGFKGSRCAFYPGVDGIMLVFDLANPRSLGTLRMWVEELLTYFVLDNVDTQSYPGAAGDRVNGRGYDNDIISPPPPTSSSAWQQQGQGLGQQSVPFILVGSKSDVRTVSVAQWQAHLPRGVSATAVVEATAIALDEGIFHSFFDRVMQHAVMAASTSATSLRELQSDGGVDVRFSSAYGGVGLGRRRGSGGGGGGGDGGGGGGWDEA